MAEESTTAWLPKEVAEHYGYPLEKTGKGQSIAVISLGGKVDLEELSKDFEDMGMEMPDISLVDVDAENIPASQDSWPTQESHLDLEVVGCICPDSKITLYRGPNPSGMAACVNKAIEDENTVISISWGSTEKSSSPTSDLEKALEAAREANITVCAASGDGGSSDTRASTGGAGPAKDGKAHVDYPASSPNVLGCGGTKEVQDDDGQCSEIVWNVDGKLGGTSGGGVSEYFPPPSWQTKAGIDIRCVNDGSTGRIVPDVSAVASAADWRIYDEGKEQVTGGTSATAPLWASLFVLINEMRGEQGKKNLGFVNEELYKIAAQGGYTIDITEGNNRPDPDYPGYDAGPGFDACSGWGSPVGAKLTEALVALD
ncbi:MAG: S53 family peptidase [Deltaproteobacteria bacterium]|nr:S53 family peptidase [Deltaproteobacteria bacterium]